MLSSSAGRAWHEQSWIEALLHCPRQFLGGGWQSSSLAAAEIIIILIMIIVLKNDIKMPQDFGLCTRGVTRKKNSPPTLSSSPSPGKEPGLFDLVIINDDLEKAYSELKEVLLEVSPWGFFPPHSWAKQVRVSSQAATELSPHPTLGLL